LKIENYKFTPSGHEIAIVKLTQSVENQHLT